MSQIIALLTDFGTDDIYTGVMKGVIYQRNPEAVLVDITHAIEPQNVRQGAFALLNAYRYFPAGTIFLIVIDPGVGSTRRPVAVAAGPYQFVAPDNGVLSYVLAELDIHFAVELTDTRFFLPQVSNTFHGRDIFAPAAAALAHGIDARQMGTPIDNLATLPQPDLVVSGRRVIGEVIGVDRFGNILTNIGRLRWVAEDRLTLTPGFGEHAGIAVPVRAMDAVITMHNEAITGINTAYSESSRGDLVALVSSTNTLEIAVNQGSAARRLDVVMGDRVELQIGDVNAAIRH